MPHVLQRSNGAPTDIGDETQCKALLDKTIATYGGLDMLINNAKMRENSPGNSQLLVSKRWRKVQITYIPIDWLLEEEPWIEYRTIRLSIESR